jgi:hypothetical protein
MGHNLRNKIEEQLLQTIIKGMGNFHIPEDQHGLRGPHGFKSPREFKQNGVPQVTLLIREGERVVCIKSAEMGEHDTMFDVVTRLAQLIGFKAERSRCQLVGFWGNNWSRAPDFLVLCDEFLGVDSKVRLKDMSDTMLQDELLELVMRMGSRDSLGYDTDGHLVIWTPAIGRKVQATLPDVERIKFANQVWGNSEVRQAA